MLFANNCNTTLNGGITAVATSMVVTYATGFPAPTGSQYFYCTLADAATQTTIEIVKVTAVSGTTFTIVRGQDGTTGTIFASGAVVSLRLVRANLNDFPKLDEDNTFAGTITFSTPLLATNMVQSTTSTSGYLSSTDWNTFNNKTSNTGTVTSVAATVPAFLSISGSPITTSGTLAITLSGTALPVANGGTGATSASITAFNNITGYTASGATGTTSTNLVFSAAPTFTGVAAFAQIRSVYDGSAGAPSLDLRNSNGVQWEWYTPTSDNTLHLDVWVPGQRDSVLTISNVAGSHNVSINSGNLSVTGVIKIGANQAVNGPAFMAYASATLSISTATFTKVRFNTTQIDTNSNFDTTNYRFTPTISGYYQVSSTVGIYGNTLTTGFTEICLYKNGAQYKFGNSIPLVLTTENQLVVSSLVYLNGSGDYVEIYVYQNSGSTLTIDSTSAYVWFSGAMVRGT